MRKDKLDLPHAIKIAIQFPEPVPGALGVEPRRPESTAAYRPSELITAGDPGFDEESLVIGTEQGLLTESARRRIEEMAARVQHLRLVATGVTTCQDASAPEALPS